MLVREILERTTSEYLHGGGANLPAWAALAEPVTSVAQTNIMLTSRNVPGNDDILEFDDDSMELARTDYRSGTTVVLAERGYLETTPATHVTGTRVIFNNPYPKHLLLQSLQGLLRQLPGFGLYRKRYATGLTYNPSAPMALPTDAIDTLAHMWVRNGLQWAKLRKGSEFETLQDTTNRVEVQFFWGGYSGSELRVPYKAAFGIPTALSDDLTDLGVPESLQSEMSGAIASRVLAGKELPEATAEHIRRQMANQQSPVGTRLSVSNALWQQFERAILRERQQQAAPEIVYS